MPVVDQLNGYRIERVLGQSQLGTAYLGLHPTQNVKVMITTLNAPAGIQAQDYGQLSLRFIREGEVLTHLAHPHILPIYAAGAEQDYWYLITAFVTEPSLAQYLKQNGRLTPQQTLPILQQLASALDYAHSQNIVHGIVSLSNIIIDTQFQTRMAGFGLRKMLEMQSTGQQTYPMSHLMTLNGHFLGSPEYISPERVIGQPVDKRSDVYSLGVLLFELLSGSPPFHGKKPLDVAVQRLRQPVPSLHAVVPQIPEAFDLVLNTMLDRDPTRRTQSAGEAARHFERVLASSSYVLPTASPAPKQERTIIETQMTLPPTVNWFDEQITPSGKWEIVPKVGTAHMPTALPPQTPSRQTSEPAEHSLGGVDPFAWWSSTSGKATNPQPDPGTFVRRAPISMKNPTGQAHSQVDQQNRRKLVSLLVAGTAAAGVLTVGGISFAHFVQSRQPAQPSSTLANTSTTSTTPQTTTSTSHATTPSTSHTTPTNHTTPTQHTAPTQPPQATSAPQPKPTTAPPAHTGTVIGHTNQGKNTSITFTNPLDGQSSLLIRTANGTFVACERTCTHAGIAVNYDTGLQKIRCPAHGAIFDQNNAFAHVSGPGNGPLTKVAIRVNADGTITTG